MGDRGRALVPHAVAGLIAAVAALQLRGLPGDWLYVREAVERGPTHWYADRGMQMGPLTIALGALVQSQTAWLVLAGALFGVFSWAARLRWPLMLAALGPWLEISARAHVDDLLVLVAAAGILRRPRKGWWFVAGVAAKPTCLVLAPMLPLVKLAWAVPVAAVLFVPFLPDVLQAGRGQYPVSVSSPLQWLVPVGSTMPGWVRPVQLLTGWAAGLALRDTSMALVPVAAFSLREWLEPVPWAYHGAVIALCACLTARLLVIAPALLLWLSYYAAIGTWRLLPLAALSVSVGWAFRSGRAQPVAGSDALPASSTP